MKELEHIEVTGIGFPNKGAELMLCAVVDSLGKRGIPAERIAVVPNRSSDYGFRTVARLGIRQKLSLQYKGLDFVPVLNAFLPDRLLRAYGCISEKKIDVILDASGLRYSDQFGWGTVFLAYQNYWRLKKRGGKLILLPQAFGPFRDKKTAYWTKKVLGLADMVYVRDKTSLGYLESLLGEDKRFRLARDFTLSYKVSKLCESQAFDEFRGKVCIIPNSKMVQKTSQSIRENYLGCLKRTIEQVQRAGLGAFVLNHEGVNDDKLCRSVASLVEPALPYTGERNAPEIKAIIGVSCGVLTSRFHGLASALYQKKPTIATSWSHKYEEVYREFGIEDGILSPDGSDEETAAIISKWIETMKSGRQQWEDRLTPMLEAQAREIEQMWDDIADIIRTNR